MRIEQGFYKKLRDDGNVPYRLFFPGVQNRHFPEQNWSFKIYTEDETVIRVSYDKRSFIEAGVVSTTSGMITEKQKINLIVCIFENLPELI